MTVRTFALASILLAACGDDGGSSGGVDAAPIDAAPVDTPAATCMFPAQLAAGAIGSMNMRASGDWVRTNNNVTTFGILIQLEDVPQGTASNAFNLTYVKPAGGFVLNQAISFETQLMGTGPASLLAFEKINTGTMMFNRVLLPTSGTITFSALGEMNGNPTTAVVSSVNFREVDRSTGADVAGGCTSTLAGLQLFMTEMNPATAPAPTTGDALPAQALLQQ